MGQQAVGAARSRTQPPIFEANPIGKFYRHLYPQIYAWDNLLLAWRKARKGKRGRPPAAAFEQN